MTSLVSVDRVPDFNQARALISGTADVIGFRDQRCRLQCRSFSWAESNDQQMELSLTLNKTSFVNSSDSYRRNFNGGTDVGSGLSFEWSKSSPSWRPVKLRAMRVQDVPGVLVMMTDATPSQVLDDDSLLADAETAKAAGITICLCRHSGSPAGSRCSGNSPTGGFPRLQRRSPCGHCRQLCVHQRR